MCVSVAHILSGHNDDEEVGNADSLVASGDDFQLVDNPFGENTVIIAVDEDKQVYEVVHHDAYTGENDYLPIGDLDTYLNGLREKVGTEISIDVAAYRSVPVSTVIEIFDKCQLEGFTHTRVRLGGKPYETTFGK